MCQDFTIWINNKNNVRMYLSHMEKLLIWNLDKSAQRIDGSFQKDCDKSVTHNIWQLAASDIVFN